jgi:hypothetical protein
MYDLSTAYFVSFALLAFFFVTTDSFYSLN